MRVIYRSVLIGALMGIWTLVVFAAGFLVSSGTISSQAESDFPLVQEVQSFLDQAYLRQQPDFAARQYGMIRGLLAALDDPNTFFIDPPVARSEADTLAGTYGGIGVLLNRNEAGEFVIYPFENSPASEAGIQAGAILLAVSGNRIQLTDQPDAVDQLLRGEVKDENGVEITVRQSDQEETYFVLFGVIEVPSVVTRLVEEDQRIGYIQILRFTSRTPQELIDALAFLKDASIEAYILDLRNNGGGLLEESVRVADQFIDDGVIMTERTRTDENEYPAEAGGEAIDLPIVVLINKNTASAAELVAGAIRDSGRGILIGQRSYGKGTVQQIFTLSDGSSVHVTSAEWLTPGRITLAGTGLVPNIEMIPDENGRDVEAGEAVRYLQSILDL